MVVASAAFQGDRTLLGAANVSDEFLSRMVARRLGVDDADDIDVLTCEVSVAEYDLHRTPGGRQGLQVDGGRLACFDYGSDPIGNRMGICV